jgi:hypothetical protein
MLTELKLQQQLQKEQFEQEFFERMEEERQANLEIMPSI